MSDQRTHVLVTGGAGYIGSHTAKALARKGFVPVTYDNLVHGHSWAVKWGALVEGDILDSAKLVETLRHYRIAAVLHFAAYAYVGESVSHPERYFHNNVGGSLALLDAVLAAGVQHIVFSSSCATYGNPAQIPITEDTPQLPVNPYGETKLVVERALRWYGEAHPLKWMALRYFNAAGADPDGELGEVHDPETHLIPLVLRAALTGKPLEIYGDDYPTADGTCMRDYIHVSDLADAHVRAIEHLLGGGGSLALNLGTGTGHTIHEVIRAVEKTTGLKVPYRVAARRPGDPAVLVADPSRAAAVLGWRAQHSGMDNIAKSARNFHSRLAGDLTKAT